MTTDAARPRGASPGDDLHLRRMRWILFAPRSAMSGVLALVDRQIISVLKPEMAAELGWTDDDYGTLGAWFQGAHGGGPPGARAR